ncbi:MAG TPA: hypothetical protein VMF89_11925 [Polyangiales bacterium]|nr:hypothetical protein [Polyangiales bacterium]
MIWKFRMMIERWNVRFIAACMMLSLVQLSAAASAQSLRIALFKTASSPELAPLTAALDPELQAEVGKVQRVSVGAVPPLDLPSLQLALDCVGETPDCLSVATERSKVDGLLSPSLARTGGSIVLSLLLYNPQASSPMQVVTRSFPNDTSEAAVIDGAKSLVRELFGVVEPAPLEEPPPPAPTVAPPEATPEVPPPPAAEHVTHPEPRQSLVLPIVLGAAGVAVIGLGIGVGVASNNTESRYGDMRVRSETDAGDTDDLLSRARTESTIANIAFGVGAASCIAAGVVYFLQRNKHRSDTEPNAHVALGPGYVGVAGDF